MLTEAQASSTIEGTEISLIDAMQKDAKNIDLPTERNNMEKELLHSIN